MTREDIVNKMIETQNKFYSKIENLERGLQNKQATSNNPFVSGSDAAILKEILNVREQIQKNIDFSERMINNSLNAKKGSNE